MGDEKQVMISVIIPVYNGEKLLERCIQTVCQQTFNNFELLLINDGSTDNSLDICQAYAKDYENVFVYTQENKGVSVARNKGIEIAKGKLICFIDADDWVENTYLESLYLTYKKENADLVISNSTAISLDKKIKGLAFHEECILNTVDNFTPDEFFKNGSFILRVSVWAKLYKKYIIENNRIKFKEDLRNGEDFIFVLEYALKSNKIVFTNDYAYFYDRTNDDSVTIKYNKQLYYDLKNTNDVYFSIIEKYRIVEKNERLQKYFVLASQAVLEEGKKSANKTFLERYKSINEILNKPEIIEFIRKYKLIESSKERVLPCIRRLMKHKQVFILTVFVIMYSKIRIKR